MKTLPTESGYFMYTKSHCKWCQKAKETLPNVVVVNVDHLLPDKNTEFLAFVDSFSGARPRTFPMVYYNGIYLGGCTESVEHLAILTQQ